VKPPGFVGGSAGGAKSSGRCQPASLQFVVMHVRQIDVHDDAEVEAWWEVSKAVDAYGREDLATHWSLRAATVAFRSENLPSRVTPLAVYDGNRIVGVNQLNCPLLDNTHLAFVSPRVLPEHRRQGVGTQLYDAALELAREA
jgi:GNAT superfamily N-acetyltransferase